MFYFFIFSILLFFAANDYDRKMNIYSGNIVYGFLFLIFWLVAGLRYETGVDWPGYTSFFKESESIQKITSNGFGSYFENEYEFGYVVLNSIIRTFTVNVQWLFLITGLGTSLLLFGSIKKYSTHIFISLLIYFCTIYFILDMSGIRQCISLNLFLVSIDYISKRKLLKYFGIILFASMFHITSLVLLPLYFVLNLKIKTWVLIIVVSIGIFISLFHISWIMLIVDKITNSFQLAAITGKLTRYSARSDSRNFGMGFILNFLIFVFCIFKRKELDKNKMFNLFLNMYVLSLFFYYFTWELTEISSRFRLYFSVGNIILFSYFLDIYKDKIARTLVFLFIISFSVYSGRIYLFEMSEGVAYNPYQNYVVHKTFGIKSTGMDRLNEFIYKQK